LRTLAELELRPPAGGPRVPASTNLRTALAVLVEQHADVLAVVDDEGNILGSVTREEVLG
jgi:CBS domain containing-hemolysin-like protein